ncbi:hypothetical protein OCU04_004519 [Sclerotinia nivalis]|uniref:Uncharacterized protein n=1 Tax=Sclerotinia nivalis TaxID=352851 RepID=A0A9X0AQZ2_9HELO|nr:hypothetical protein OCU04_004519 [Sclerotinia nivalis]
MVLWKSVCPISLKDSSRMRGIWPRVSECVHVFHELMDASLSLSDRVNNDEVHNGKHMRMKHQTSGTRNAQNTGTDKFEGLLSWPRTSTQIEQSNIRHIDGVKTIVLKKYIGLAI